MDRKSFLKNSALLFLATGLSQKVPSLVSGIAEAQGVQKGDSTIKGGNSNMALGQKVLFAPKPNYASTAKGNTDESDLTDGKIFDIDNSSATTEEKAWTNPGAVGWNYDSSIGRVNLSIDLGKGCEIDEVAIRVLHRKMGFSVPGWVEVWVSDDGINYRKVAERSRWDNPSYYQGENSVISSAETQMHRFSFNGLDDVHGRYVGLRMTLGKSMIADELYVYGKESGQSSNAAISDREVWGGFSVTEPQPYFHKPKLVIPSNITAPQVMGIVTGQEKLAEGNLKVEFDLPPGISWDSPEPAKKSTLSDGWSRIQIGISDPRYSRQFLQFFMRAESADRKGHIRWRYYFNGQKRGELEMPFSTVSVAETPAPKRMETVGFGWWTIGDSMQWPDSLETFQHVGLNAISLYSTSTAPNWISSANSKEEMAFIELARKKGFKIFGADSTFMPPWRKALQNKSMSEVFCQPADGTKSKSPCPSYRGKYYQEELDRFATKMAKFRPEYLGMDSEHFGGSSKMDAKRCTRCTTDFKASGLGDWDQWWFHKTSEMIREAITAARDRLREEGADPNFMATNYNMEREGGVHPRRYWNLDMVYPEYYQVANPYYYTQCYPEDLLLLVNMVRRNREKYKGIWQLLSPGDYGPTPGDAFKWSILESYANGARGVLFWSQRGWDAEYLIAYSDAIRAIVPVEDVIIDGELLGDIALVHEPGHISGMKHGNKMVLLISDYKRVSNGTLQLSIELDVSSQIIDLETREIVEKHLPAGKQHVSIGLKGEAARLLEVTPIK